MSKGKLIVMALSLAAVAASIFIYFNQSTSPAEREQKDYAVKSKLRGFELYRYKNDQLIARTTGRDATLHAQGRLVCDGRIQMVKIESGQRQEVESDQAELVFEDENFFSENGGGVETILFSGNVDYTKGSSRFRTDWIKYSEKTGEAFTDKPVRIDFENQFIASEGGMIFNTKTDSFRMKGGIFGSVRPDFVKSNRRGNVKK